MTRKEKAQGVLRIIELTLGAMVLAMSLRFASGCSPAAAASHEYCLDETPQLVVK